MIRPNECPNVPAGFEQKIQTFEKEVDVQLQNNFWNQKSYVKVGLRGADLHVMRELQKRYTEVGWHVKYTDDQRDGNFLTFRKTQE